jgi:DNA-binding response OmpR family regulator
MRSTVCLCRSISTSAFLEPWRGSRTPVVVLSSSMNPAARELCLALGAREFVTKPVELVEFQKAVGRIVEQWEARVVSVDPSVTACVGRSIGVPDIASVGNVALMDRRLIVSRL